MKTLTPKDRAPAMFRALADPTRVRILHLLKEGELCVCDLMDVLKFPQAKTSRHLRYLLKAGLVTVEERGNWSFYSLAEPRDAFHQSLLECLAEIPRVDRNRKGGGCCP